MWWHVQSRNKRSVARRSAQARRPGDRARARRTRRHRRREFPSRHARGLGPRLRRARARAIPDSIMVRISGLWANRSVPRAPGLRRDRRSDGRTAPRDRHAGPAAVARRRLDRRHAVGAVRRHRRDVRARASAQDRLGQVVDVALYESVFSVMESLLPEFDAFGAVRERTGSILPGIAPTSAYRCNDGSYVLIAGNGDSIFKRLCGAMGRDDLASDPSLAHNDGRAARQAWLDERDRGLDVATLAGRRARRDGSAPTCPRRRSTRSATSSPTRTTRRAT